MQQHPAFSPQHRQQHQNRPLLNRPGLFRGTDRIVPLSAKGMSFTDISQGTLPAFWLGVGETKGFPQFHHRLIEGPGLIAGNHLPGDSGKRLLSGRAKHIGIDGQQTRQHPHDIAVHRRDGKTKGDGRHRSGGILSDAGQGQQLLVGRR